MSSFFTSRMHSFRYAFRGLAKFFLNERNAWLHLAATIAVIIACSLLPVSTGEVISLVVVIGMVWVAEAFNTALERLVDLVSPGKHELAGLVKDIAAAAVLLSSLTALIVGCIIFIPKFF